MSRSARLPMGPARPVVEAFSNTTNSRCSGCGFEQGGEPMTWYAVVGVYKSKYTRGGKEYFGDERSTMFWLCGDCAVKLAYDLVEKVTSL